MIGVDDDFAERVSKAVADANLQDDGPLDSASWESVAPRWRRVLASSQVVWVLVHTAWWLVFTPAVWGAFQVSGTIGFGYQLLAVFVASIAAIGTVGCWVIALLHGPGVYPRLVGAASSRQGFPLLRTGIEAARVLRKTGSRRRVRREVKELYRLARLERDLRRNLRRLDSPGVEPLLVEQVAASLEAAQWELASLSVALGDLRDVEVADRAARAEVFARTSAQQGIRRSERRAEKLARRAEAESLKLTRQSPVSERTARLREDAAERDAEAAAYREVKE